MKTISFKAVIVCCLLVFATLNLFCSKPKEGKAVVTEQEVFIKRVSENGVELGLKGIIKNIGEADLKNVVVTGYCRSCGEVIIPGQWFVSNIDKTSEQKDVVNYLGVGQQAEFNFSGVALLLTKAGEEANEVPENVEAVVESFEVVK